MELSEDKIVYLLDESIKKLESTAIQDSKKLSDMNNALNWILTLTTFLFLFYIQHPSLKHTSFSNYLSIFSKICFVISLIVLIIHKIFLIQYEDYKGAFLASLRTHNIQLKFDLKPLKKAFNFPEPIHTGSFINSFREGAFLSNYDKEKTKIAFTKMDNKINLLGNLLRFTYKVGLILFFIILLIVAFRLFTPDQ